MPQNKSIMQEVSRLRDELKLQSHLFKMQAKQEWEQLEKKWQSTEGRLRQATSKTETQLGAANALVLEELKAGYERIKKALKGEDS